MVFREPCGTPHRTHQHLATAPTYVITFKLVRFGWYMWHFGVPYEKHVLPCICSNGVPMFTKYAKTTSHQITSPKFATCVLMGNEPFSQKSIKQQFIYTRLQTDFPVAFFHHEPPCFHALQRVYMQHVLVFVIFNAPKALCFLNMCANVRALTPHFGPNV